jgi:hypothetical protein
MFPGKFRHIARNALRPFLEPAVLAEQLPMLLLHRIHPLLERRQLLVDAGLLRLEAAREALGLPEILGQSLALVLLLLERGFESFLRGTRAATLKLLLEGCPFTHEGGLILEELLVFLFNHPQSILDIDSLSVRLAKSLFQDLMLFLGLVPFLDRTLRLLEEVVAIAGKLLTLLGHCRMLFPEAPELLISERCPLFEQPVVGLKLA